MKSLRVLLPVLVALLLVPASVRVPAQLRVAPVGERPDEESLERLLRKLASTGTFMQTTAHPDDEDSALLAKLGHGQGKRTVLVTATRGNGGQNEIGPELFEPLGVLRTEELLAVHRFDGAEQFFTRAIDFGYSFSVEESIEKWGHDEILGDFVRHIRAVRPDVIAGFVCGGKGGGQHHQASAVLTIEAFRAAADPTKFPDQIKDGLRPWQAMRVFCTEGFGPLPGPRTPDLQTIDVSGFDPALGRTYEEVGLEARSMHKCQGTSQLLLLPGQSLGRTYRLRDSTLDPGNQAPSDLFASIDTSLRGLARFIPRFIGPGHDTNERALAALTTALEGIAKDVTDAQQSLTSTGPASSVPPLADGLRALRQLRAELRSVQFVLPSDSGSMHSGGMGTEAELVRDPVFEMDFRLAQKERQFQDALVIADGLTLDALSDDGLVTAGQGVKLSTFTARHGSAPASLNGVTLAGFDAASVAACQGPIDPSRPVNCTAAVHTSAQAHLSTPYWTPRQDAARYDFEPDVPFGVPFRPSPFVARFTLTIGGADVAVERVVQYRYNDVMAGEKRMELKVVPPFNVRVTPDIMVVPVRAAGARRDVRVSIGNNEKGASAGAVTLQAPAGWQVEPASATVTFGREDEEVTVKFAVKPPAGARPGEFLIKALMTAAAGAKSDLGYQVVEYPHIHRRHVIEDATTRVKAIDVSIAPGLDVGYIMGVGDQVPEAIQQLGARVELIDADTLASGDLSKYNVIVVGVRAYERRADLRANNQRLLQYAENGGTVIVQYARTEFNQAQYGPYPAKTTGDRVTDENAPIEILAPDHPIFNTPNKIGPETWAGWVQERGAYFLGERDPRYVDLVRSADPFPYNAGPKTGILVEAKIGRGRWLYTGLGLWRQLPAGTEGAYRLLANLLSLGKP